MNVADALHGAWNDARGSAPASVAGLVAALGGTKAAAALLPAGPRSAAPHASQRTVERYIKFEREGASKSNRQISATNREKLTEAVNKQLDAAAAARVRDRGMTTEAKGQIVMSDKTGHRSIDERMTGDDLADMLDAIERGDWDAAGEAFEETLFDEYYVATMRFTPGGVDELVLSL